MVEWRLPGGQLSKSTYSYFQIAAPRAAAMHTNHGLTLITKIAAPGQPYLNDPIPFPAGITALWAFRHDDKNPFYLFVLKNK
jgi:hypothetical protein